MGPRSVERGKNALKPGLNRIFIASMGPRSVERGKIAFADRKQGNDLASMGPRSVERGKRRPPAPCRRLAELQWGRVLLNAERSPVEPPMLSPQRFNGAAFC